MTARHCPGCRDYTRDWATSCPGVEISVLGEEFMTPDVVPSLPLRSRLKVLLGLPVLLGVSLGPLGEPFTEVPGPDQWSEPETREFWAGPDGWKDSA